MFCLYAFIIFLLFKEKNLFFLSLFFILLCRLICKRVNEQKGYTYVYSYFAYHASDSHGTLSYTGR